MADRREKKADRFGSAGAPSYAAGFSTETAGAMSGVLDSANRLVSNSSYAYKYDDDGNQTARANPTPNDTASYSYDSENRLIGISLSNGQSVTYQYDALSRRIETSTGIGIARRTIYDGDDALAYLNAENSPTDVHVFGKGMDFPLGITRGINEFFSTHHDRLNSVNAVCDSSGEVIERIEYLSFGEPTYSTAISSSSASPLGLTFGLASREVDNIFGVYDHRLRARSIVDGRFLSMDPTSPFNGELSGYAYANGNPITYVDPFGLWGLGLQFGYEGEAGLVGGVGTQVGGGAGYFSKGLFCKSSIGVFGYNGAFVGSPASGTGSPKQSSGFVAGAAVSKGFSFFFAGNASSASDLAGPFDTVTGNLGKLLAQFGFQIAWDPNKSPFKGGAYVVSISPPGAAFTVGVSLSKYRTTTTVVLDKKLGGEN